MPLLYDTLYTKMSEKTQEIAIDLSSEYYLNPYHSIGRKVREFINFTLGIIKQKPEIKNSPQSYILYE